MNAAAILFATDLSGPARQCHAPAAALAKAFGAHLSVLHVDDVAPDQLDPVEGLHAYLDMVSAFRRLRIEQLHADFATLGVTPHFLIEHGKPERVIDAYSRAHDVGLIVMGQHSRQGPLRKLLGATTNRVMHLSDLPVLVVPIDDDRPDAPPDPRPARFATVLVPSALTDACDRAVRAALALATQLGARVHVTHAIGLPAFVPLSAGEGYAPPELTPPTHLEAHYRGELVARLARVAPGADLECTALFAESAVAGILAEAKRLDADLILVPSTGKGAVARLFLGSVTEALAHRAPMPVMVLPPPYLAAWAS